MPPTLALTPDLPQRFVEVEDENGGGIDNATTTSTYTLVRQGTECIGPVPQEKPGSHQPGLEATHQPIPSPSKRTNELHDIFEEAYEKAGCDQAVPPDVSAYKVLKEKRLAMEVPGYINPPKRSISEDRRADCTRKQCQLFGFFEFEGKYISNCKHRPPCLLTTSMLADPLTRPKKGRKLDNVSTEWLELCQNNPSDDEW